MRLIVSFVVFGVLRFGLVMLVGIYVIVLPMVSLSLCVYAVC